MNLPVPQDDCRHNGLRWWDDVGQRETHYQCLHCRKQVIIGKYTNVDMTESDLRSILYMNIGRIADVIPSHYALSSGFSMLLG